MTTDEINRLILVGGGGHALSLLESLPEGVQPVGYTALSPSDSMPLRWLGNEDTDEDIFSIPARFHIAFVYAGLPEMKKREKLIRKFQDAGVRFRTLISPTALVSKNSEIGEGSAVLSGAIINRAVIGNHVVVNTGAIVEHDCIVGDNTFIGPGAVMGGFVRIGKNCFIGLGAKIRNGLTIADNVSIGMGAIVTHDLTAPGIYHGLPLKYFPFES